MSAREEIHFNMPISERALLELSLVEHMLQCYLQTVESSLHDELRQVVLTAIVQALIVKYNLSNSWFGGEHDLLESGKQLQLLVVSQGGLNDTALNLLKNDDGFKNLIRNLPPFAESAFGDMEVPLVLPARKPNDFDSGSCSPCVIGSGRLASAFLVGFKSIGIADSHVTIVSRRQLTSITPPATWMSALLDEDVDMKTYNRQTFDEDPPQIGRGPVFLLIKRKAFNDSKLLSWYKKFVTRNESAVVINLMAGGALETENKQELTVRANVLVAQPFGGNLLCNTKDVGTEAWLRVAPMLRCLGTILPVPNEDILARLTFFTSTVPLVFLTEIDQICFSGLPSTETRSLVQAAAIQRIHAFEARLSGNKNHLKANNPKLRSIATRYMEAYFGMESAAN